MYVEMICASCMDSFIIEPLPIEGFTTLRYNELDDTNTKQTKQQRHFCCCFYRGEIDETSVGVHSIQV